MWIKPVLGGAINTLSINNKALLATVGADIGLVENVGPTDENAGNINETSDIDDLLLGC